MKKTMIAALLLFGTAAVFAAITDITGKWTGAVLGPDGNSYNLTYVFKIDGENLTGTSDNTLGINAIEHGKIKDNEFVFDISANGMVIPHKGKVYTDSIALDIDYNGTPLHTVLKRAAE
ncbi:glycoside hydrolase [Pedobacter sp. HMF7647]|uniref:Glycoside hydrolase n=1 Tax=Hufsiella arboris TaxID=2695275 RepID=A0A7K1Y8X3_9SPHI|nr:glycoside hydrolase [Hufsiella arboris]MXV51027.1 glycoside hydrolase [Hufsiella arboris]